MNIDKDFSLGSDVLSISNNNIADVCMLELVILLLLDYMWGSIGVHHL